MKKVLRTYKFKCISCGHEANADFNDILEILKRGRADLSNVKVEH